MAERLVGTLPVVYDGERLVERWRGAGRRRLKAQPPEHQAFFSARPEADRDENPQLVSNCRRTRHGSSVIML